MKSLKARRRKQRADLRRDRGLQRLAQQRADEFGRALAGLDRDVADEAIADGDVDPAVEEVAAFDVSDEVDGATSARSSGKRIVGELVALGVLFADGEQADARAG